MSSQRHVCVVTGSRAEFGLLRPVMESIREHPQRLLVACAVALDEIFDQLRNLIAPLSQRRNFDVDDVQAEKLVLPIEEDVRIVARQSLVTVRDLPHGHGLSRDDLTVKRPGTGIEPWRLDAVVGQRLGRAVESDRPLTDNDLAPFPMQATAVAHAL